VTDVEVLAGEARGVLRKKILQLKEALAGQLEPVYLLVLRQQMDQVRLVRRQVEEINQALAAAMQEHLAALHRLTKIPGVDLYAAQELLAEIGPKAAAFGSAERFASWVGVCPGSQQSSEDRLGGYPHQRHFLRVSVCPAEAERPRQRRRLGCGASHRQGHLAGFASRSRISGEGFGHGRPPGPQPTPTSACCWHLSMLELAKLSFHWPLPNNISPLNVCGIS
jgi:hypothetical protein